MNASEAKEKAANARKHIEAERVKRVEHKRKWKAESMAVAKEGCKPGGRYHNEAHKKIQESADKGSSSCTYGIYQGNDVDRTKAVRDDLLSVLTSEGYTVEGSKVTSEDHEADPDWPHPAYTCLVCKLKISW